MEKEGYSVPTAPNLARLRADRPISQPPPPAAAPKAPARSAPVKPLGKKAAQWAAESFAKQPTDPAKEQQSQAKLWNQIMGYRRNWPDLDHNKKVNADSPSAVMAREISSVQAQKGDERAIANAQLIYVMALNCAPNIASVWNPVVPYPMQLQLEPSKVRKESQRMVYQEGFMRDELTEITILYPWLFRPGPEMRLLVGSFQFLQMCSNGAGMTAAMGTSTPMSFKKGDDDL